MKKINSGATDYFRDSTGRVGKLYDARTTPHMFVIDPQGKIAKVIPDVNPSGHAAEILAVLSSLRS